jgi:hypothetical protein
MVILNFKLHTWRITIGLCPYFKFMERKHSRNGAKKAQSNDFFTNSAMVILNFKLPGTSPLGYTLYCKFMKCKRSCDGAVRPSRTITIGLCPILQIYGV